jgi:hypothetical protein
MVSETRERSGEDNDTLHAAEPDIPYWAKPHKYAAHRWPGALADLLAIH